MQNKNEEELSLLQPHEQENNNTNQQLQRSRTFICVKSTICAFALAFIILNTLYQFALPSTIPPCYDDLLFNFTGKINHWFSINQNAKYVCLIISSICLDLLTIIFAIIWTINGQSLRPVFAFISYFLLRLICINVYKMVIPDGYLFDYPGFPSLTISYAKTNDLFFSSFLGISLIICLECYKMKQFSLVITSICVLVFQVVLVIFLRGNYFIDIVSALVVAHYSHMMMDEFCRWLENNNYLSLEKQGCKREKIPI